MSRQGPFRAVTLGDLIDASTLLWIYCLGCGRECEIHPAALPVARSVAVPRSVPVPELARRLRCSACGGREIETKAAWFPGGVIAGRALHRGGSPLVPRGTGANSGRWSGRSQQILSNSESDEV